MHTFLSDFDWASGVAVLAQAASGAATKPGSFDSLRDWMKGADRITLLTLGSMILCSLAAVTVAIERTLQLWNLADASHKLAEQVRRALYRGAIPDARTACQRSKSPLADVMLVGFERLGRGSEDALRAAVEDRTVTLPNDRDTFADFRLVKLVKGVPRVPENARNPERGQSREQRHGDSAIAAVLAYAASRAVAFTTEGYQAVKGSPGDVYEPDADRRGRMRMHADDLDADDEDFRAADRRATW